MRRSLILSVAYQKFSEKGYHASLSEIAKDSGIKKQTLYNYYENKDDLFYEIIERETTHYFTEIKEQYNSHKTVDTEANLKLMFMLNMDYFRDEKKYRFWRWLIAIDSVQLRTKCDAIIDDYKKGLLDILEDVFHTGIQDGVIRSQSKEALVHTFIVLFHGTLMGLVFYESLITRETLINDVWETFWNGIANK